MLLVILAIAALAILAGVVMVSMGKGGELTEFPPDVPPLNLPEAGRMGAVDVMALQLPLNLIGYHTQSVDETLRRAAEALSARDTRIAVLEQRVSELLSSQLQARQEVYAAPGNGPRTEHEPPATPLALPAESDPLSNGHLPAPADEPASADHEPVTWADPATPRTDASAPDADTADPGAPASGPAVRDADAPDAGASAPDAGLHDAGAADPGGPAPGAGVRDAEAGDAGASAPGGAARDVEAGDADGSAVGGVVGDVVGNDEDGSEAPFRDGSGRGTDGPEGGEEPVRASRGGGGEARA